MAAGRTAQHDESIEVLIEKSLASLNISRYQLHRNLPNNGRIISLRNNTYTRSFEIIENQGSVDTTIQQEFRNEPYHQLLRFKIGCYLICKHSKKTQGRDLFLRNIGTTMEGIKENISPKDATIIFDQLAEALESYLEISFEQAKRQLFLAREDALKLERHPDIKTILN